MYTIVYYTDTQVSLKNISLDCKIHATIQLKECIQFLKISLKPLKIIIQIQAFAKIIY